MAQNSEFLNFFAEIEKLDTFNLIFSKTGGDKFYGCECAPERHTRSGAVFAKTHFSAQNVLFLAKKWVLAKTSPDQVCLSGVHSHPENLSSPFLDNIRLKESNFSISVKTIKNSRFWAILKFWSNMPNFAYF